MGSNLDAPGRAGARRPRRAGAVAAHAADGALRRSTAAPPWGRADQPDFVNAVARPGDRARPARAARRAAGDRGRGRAACAAASAGGRARSTSTCCSTASTGSADARLVLPHPGIAERAFVLVPLAALAPQLEIPGAGRVGALAAAVPAGAVEALEEEAAS
ncbi:MAG: 2-amino-4-hydroxy-6-hydroxymethyldihydropteridine diphosphokinase [Halofilum sp. (in: g-proteobacteria)]|nr:2-amino-4-hydroxy-6-hydroxymethyldihydropteridine diphosphokinase [Halofilum sp. (in: g-proteobacteria)]